MAENARARQTSASEPAPERLVQTVLMPVPTPASDAVDFVALARFIRRQWLTLLACSMFGAVIGYGVSHLFPKIYRADVLLAPVSTDDAGGSSLKSLASRYGSLASLAGINLDAGRFSTATVLAMLQSRRFIEQFIADNKLLPILFAKQWDASTSRWKGAPEHPAPTLDDGYQVFVKTIMSVTEDRKTTLVTMTIDWRDGKLAADWANMLVARVNEATRDLAIRNANLSIDYLNTELRTAETIELRQSIFALLQSQMEKRMLASTHPEFSFTVVDPAQPPNPRRYVSPQRIRFALCGLALGLLLGFAMAGALESRARARLESGRSPR
jgi:uncharacterized protein involved in exopolysaccharide biosynthesis